MQSGPRRIVHAIADALFDKEVPSVVDDVLAFVATASFTSRVTLWLALWVLRLAPILVVVSWRPLDRLDRDRRREVLSRIEGAKGLGLALVAWRTLLVLHFYEDARELARIGYREERRRHLAVIPAPAASGVRLRGGGEAHGAVAVDSEEPEQDQKGAA